VDAPAGLVAVAAVIAQALLGGAMVETDRPKGAGDLPPALAEICFGLTVAITAGYYGVSGAGDWVSRLAVAALFVQGYSVRRCGMARWAVTPHIAGRRGRGWVADVGQDWAAS